MRNELTQEYFYNTLNPRVSKGLSSASKELSVSFYCLAKAGFEILFFSFMPPTEKKMSI